MLNESSSLLVDGPIYCFHDAKIATTILQAASSSQIQSEDKSILKCLLWKELGCDHDTLKENRCVDCCQPLKDIMLETFFLVILVRLVSVLFQTVRGIYSACDSIAHYIKLTESQTNLQCNQCAVCLLFAIQTVSASAVASD